MCRLTAYFGKPLLVADLVTRPERSVIRQSFDARERMGGLGAHVYEIGALNADGFGLGWYSSCGNNTPCVFTEIGPAWNNANLIRLARKIESTIIFAHVRAAGPGMGVSVESSHPFEFGRYLFMHNGQVGGFSKIRRNLLGTLNDVAYDFALQHNCSDTAVAFAIFIDLLGDKTGMLEISPAKLQLLLQQTIEKICDACVHHNVTEVSLLNFVVSDGKSLAASRFVHGGQRCASLYFASGSSFEPESPLDGDSVCRYRMLRQDKVDEVVIITSEPLTEERADWVPIPANHILLVSPSKRVLLTPVVRCTDLVSCKHRKERNEFAGRMMTRLGLDDDQFLNRKSLLYDSMAPRYVDCCGASLTSSPTRKSRQTAEKHEETSFVTPDHTMTGVHTSSIMAIARIGKYLFSAEAGMRGTICMWDTSVWKCVGTHHLSHGGILAMTMDEARKLLYVSCSNNYISALQLSFESDDQVSLDTVFDIKLPSVGHVLTIALDALQNHLYIGSQDCCLRQIVLPDSTVRGGTHEYCIVKVDTEADPHELLHFDLYKAIPLEENCECSNKQLDISDISGVTTHCSFINQVLICNDFVVTAGGDSIVKLWRKSDRSSVTSLFGHRDSVLALAADHQSNILFSGSLDGSIRVWDLASFGCRREICCGSFVSALNLSMHRLGKGYLFSSHGDQVLRAHKLYSYEPVLVFRTHAGQVLCVETHDDDDHENDSKVERMSPSSSIRAQHMVTCGTSAGTVVCWALRARLQKQYSYSSMWCDVIENVLDLDTICDDDASINNTILELLRIFIRLRSVSARIKYHEECWTASRFIADVLEKLGSDVKICFGATGSDAEGVALPVVLAKFHSSTGSSRNVVFYSHYDVVDAEDGNWTTDPWNLSGIDGFLYGRGSSDAKGPLLACILAVYALHSQGKLPVDVTFIIEGQEESGINTKKRGFENIINAHMDWFANACAIIISNNYWIDDARPCLTYGMRGVVDVEVQVEGQENNLHAGIHGGCLHEATADLFHIIGSLKTHTGAISIPQLHENIREISSKEQAMLERINLNLDEYRKETGTSSLRTTDPVNVLKSRWSLPALSVSSIITSNPSESFRSIPSVAAVRLSLHFVPDQSSSEIIDALSTHLEQEFQKISTKNKLSVKICQVSEWWLGEIDNGVFSAAETAVESVWGVKPLYVREGGSYGGITAMLERSLGAPAIHLPMGQATDRAHLANERIRVENLFRGRLVIQSLLEHI